MSNSDTNSEIENELLDVEQVFCQAHVEKDYEVIDRLLATEFVGISHAGDQVDRAEYLEIHLDPNRDFETFRTSETEVRYYTGTALLTGKQTIARVDHKPEESRYMAIYIERDRGWRIAAWQDTPLREDWILNAEE